MAQDRARQIISMKSLSATIPAYVVVKPGTAKNTCALYDTSTAKILGVTAQQSGASGTSVAVVIAGVAKVICGASVSAGAIVAVQTATGYVVEAAAVAYNHTTTTVIPRTLGIALMAGSTNAVIDVAIQINNIAFNLA